MTDEVRNGQYGGTPIRLLLARCEVVYIGRLTARLPKIGFPTGIDPEVGFRRWAS